MTHQKDQAQNGQTQASDQWPKVCPFCDASHSENDWEMLRYAGFRDAPLTNDGHARELRECNRCAAIISLKVTNDFA